RVRSSASSATNPCIWPVSPTASTSSPPASPSAVRTASIADVHQMFGSCSLHRGCGVSNGYATAADARTAPDRSTTTALTAVVETSRPSTLTFADLRAAGPGVPRPSPSAEQQVDRELVEPLVRLTASGQGAAIELEPPEGLRAVG